MKEFNEYIETNQWLKKLMDELNEEDGMRLEDSFYAFKKHCTKAENLPISGVRLSFSDEKFRELFNELIMAGRDMQIRDNLGNSYMSEDMYFKDVKARYSNEA